MSRAKRTGAGLAGMPNYTTPNVKKPHKRLDFSLKTTAPKWTGNLDDRIAWCVWFVSQNPLVVKKFFELADNYQGRNPDSQFSSELIVNVMRYHSSTRTEGDQYGISSNSKSLLARLYLQKYPNAPLDTRRCWINSLQSCEWQKILDAWQPVNGAGA